MIDSPWISARKTETLGVTFMAQRIGAILFQIGGMMTVSLGLSLLSWIFRTLLRLIR